MTHVRTLLSHSSKIFIGLLAAALIFSWTTQPAIGHHQPANKFAAAGAAADDIGPDEEHVVLSETMKVPTTHDLAISATMECSILTYLRTLGGPEVSEETSRAEGRVDVWVTIDGTRVPVQSTGEGAPDNGEVTFCNREYERRVGDAEENENNNENNGDGIDNETDFIKTRSANAFNWFALNIGPNYDKPNIPEGTSTNVVLVELWVRYHRENPNTESCTADTSLFATQEDCSDAWVGKRTLVAEPTNASVHENVEPADTPEEPGDQEPAPEPCLDPTGMTCGVTRD